MGAQGDPQPRPRSSARMRSRTRMLCAADGESVSFKDLLESWRTGAAAPRTVQTYTVRLPVDDAARLAALADMFPGRTPEQLITELLSQALQELAAAMPYVAGKRVISTDEQGDPLYADEGPTPRFMELAREHRQRLEAAAAPAARAPKKKVTRKRPTARR
jgi:predicted DNA-binding protein